MLNKNLNYIYGPNIFDKQYMGQILIVSTCPEPEVKVRLKLFYYLIY